MGGTWGVVNNTVVQFRGKDGAQDTAFLQQLALETDTVLFDLRAAHDSVLALAINHQIVQDVRAKLFEGLAGKLSDVLTAAGFVVLREVKNASAGSTVTLKRVHSAMETPGPEHYLVPAMHEADLASTVYPAASQGAIEDMVRSIPSRARGYQLAASVRAYLSGHRDDAAAGPNGEVPSRPWGADGSDLLSRAAILDEAETIDTICKAALTRTVDDNVWLVTKLNLRGFSVPPFVSGSTVVSHTHNVPAPFSGAPTLSVLFDYGRRRFEFRETGDAPTRTFAVREHNKWVCYQQALGQQTRVIVVDVQFSAMPMSTSHLHNVDGTGYTPSTLIGVTKETNELRWQCTDCVVLCGSAIDGHTTCWATAAQNAASCSEALAPHLARRAAANDATASQKLRNLLTQWPPSKRDSHRRAVISKKLDDGYELHAYHGAMISVASGRNDVPVIRIGGESWFTGQHTLAATTGMMLARRIAAQQGHVAATPTLAGPPQ